MQDVLSKYPPVKLGEKLQSSRKNAGFTQQDVAEELGMARTSITAIENGDRNISPEELVKLCRMYNRKVSDIIEELQFETEPFRVQFRSMWKKRDQYAEEIKEAILRFERLCRKAYKLEQLLKKPLRKYYPPEYALPHRDIEQEAEHLARQERNRLGLGDAPIGSMRDLLEFEVGIRVFFIPMPSSISEIYTYDEKLGACMAVNARHSNSPGRQRFSMAHGYVHFLVHRHDKIVDEVERRNRSKQEQLADRFSPHFLMPDSAIQKLYHHSQLQNGEFQVSDLFNMAYYFGVSIQALVRRLEELELVKRGILEEIQYSGHKIGDIWDSLNIPGLKEKERLDTYPKDFENNLHQAWVNGDITESQLADILDVDVITARDFVNRKFTYSNEGDTVQYS